MTAVNAARDDWATSRVQWIGQTRVVEVLPTLQPALWKKKLTSDECVLAGKLVAVADMKSLVKRL